MRKLVKRNIDDRFAANVLLWIGNISCLPVMNSPKPLPHKFPIRTAYVNFGHPSLPIYQTSRYFAMDLTLKIEILHAP